ncbi:MAG TPA: phosphoglucosamine mutase [Planctomycetota bacterium]|jgi:phosphomannomutase|nr:phosphoglucosamine mutase [Planctomycetota bacterium]OQC21519.1 MAG: Phosphoglucosamine mutase [Planctomycetes bacterium ADurb.Bin069]HNS00235.1 phosphoglucosamine mutase [Planctomycetota bacterium]HNU26156.1 phosphoglucosamine mutase [Planctomycetota bacterium]HOE28836.1 phosphoglucosamine mutase [Planctomycetota bacterium]
MSRIASLKISVSGVRGIVGQSLTPQLVTAFAAAFGSYAGRGPVLVGSDTRPSRHMVMPAVAAGLMSTGAEVVDLGICPVPSIQYMVAKTRAFGGIAVTASHNPIEWNALKFIGPKGLFLNQYRAEEVLDIYHQGEFRRVRDGEVRSVRRERGAFAAHLEGILKHIDREAIARRGFRVMVDCVNGAGAVATPELLAALGCRATVMHTSVDEPFPHCPEPIAENLQELVRTAREAEVDIAFAQDADADRLAIVSAKRGAIGEEYTVALAVKQVLKRVKAPVVVNLSTTQLVEDIAAAAGVEVQRTKVGEINVTERLLAVNGAVGGEGTGGAIIPAIHPCRDSFAAMATVLQLLAEEERSLEEIIDGLPRYAIVKRKAACPPERVFRVLRRIEETLGDGAAVDRSDGVRLTWERKWLHVRSSNTEPIMRVVAEAPGEDEARRLADKALVELKRCAE